MNLNHWWSSQAPYKAMFKSRDSETIHLITSDNLSPSAEGDLFFAFRPFFDSELIYINPTDVQQVSQDRLLSWSDVQLPQIQSVVPNMNYEQWLTHFKNAQMLLNTGTEKIVLSRALQIKLKNPIDEKNLLPCILKEATLHGRLQNSYLIVCITPETTFISLTPERVAHFDYNLLETEALAGTRKRGMTEDEDRAIAVELFESEKDRHEHNVVIEFIKKALGQYSSDIHILDTEIKKLRTLQHLYTPIECELSSNHMVEVLRSLHPTPAVAGEPREKALEWLKMHESHRQLYAGLYGFGSNNQSEWAVGLRCIEIHSTHLLLTTGVGVTRQSDPQQEWQELDSKTSTWLGLFEDIQSEYV